MTSEFDETFVLGWKAFRKGLGQFLNDEEIDLFELKIGAEGKTTRERIEEIVNQAAVELMRGLVKVKDSRRVGQLTIQADIAIERFRAIDKLVEQYTELLDMCHGHSRLRQALAVNKTAIRANTVASGSTYVSTR